jgi:hypothetical protein
VERGRVSHGSIIRKHVSGQISTPRRISYAGISLSDIPSDGYSRYLDEEEMSVISRLLHHSSTGTDSSLIRTSTDGDP